MHRRAEHKAVRFLGALDQIIHAVGKHAFAARLPATPAADAAPDGLRAYLEQFPFHAGTLQGARHFHQRGIGAARLSGAAIHKQNFHIPSFPQSVCRINSASIAFWS